MIWPWEEGCGHERALPRIRHWMMSAAILLIMGIAVPLFAGFA
ncbi:hypothetical protein [Sphingobium lactosutens]|nr:hypothetical protein [Sphingobium lactosutens]